MQGHHFTAIKEKTPLSLSAMYDVLPARLLDVLAKVPGEPYVTIRALHTADLNLSRLDPCRLAKQLRTLLEGAREGDAYADVVLVAEGVCVCEAQLHTACMSEAAVDMMW